MIAPIPSRIDAPSARALRRRRHELFVLGPHDLAPAVVEQHPAHGLALATPAPELSLPSRSCSRRSGSGSRAEEGDAVLPGVSGAPHAAADTSPQVPPS